MGKGYANLLKGLELGDTPMMRICFHGTCDGVRRNFQALSMVITGRGISCDVFYILR